ncbi:hypothetical protein PPACK8108_LOCUS25873 [Phakopsora pachyrhizi]|uniref:Uncharacterized protein n=1 Tax=Phakopsora pachyrhizi TaxID=170000 RepID=A0AAV0BSP2_PHAPC|nr:hypothetical protein PPACK8108_LOCUS25873 [Phakopsora pachyrhizi]
MNIHQENVATTTYRNESQRLTAHIFRDLSSQLAQKLEPILTLTDSAKMRSSSLLQLNLRMAPTVIKQRANSFPELERGPIDDKFMPGAVLLAGSGSEEVRELAKRLAAEELKRIDVVVVVMAKIGLLKLIGPNNRLIGLCDPPVQRNQDWYSVSPLPRTAMWASIKPISNLFRFQRTRRNSEPRDSDPRGGSAIEGQSMRQRVGGRSNWKLPTRNLFEVLGENYCHLELFQANMNMEEGINGQVWSWGINDNPALGRKTKVNSAPILSLAPIFDCLSLHHLIFESLHLLLERSDQEEEDDDDEIESLKHDKASNLKNSSISKMRRVTILKKMRRNGKRIQSASWHDDTPEEPCSTVLAMKITAKRTGQMDLLASVGKFWRWLELFKAIDGVEDVFRPTHKGMGMVDGGW